MQASITGTLNRDMTASMKDSNETKALITLVADQEIKGVSGLVWQRCVK